MEFHLLYPWSPECLLFSQQICWDFCDYIIFAQPRRVLTLALAGIWDLLTNKAAPRDANQC